MESNDISSVEDCIRRICQFDLQFIGSRLRQEGVKSDNLHVEPLRPFYKLAPNPSHSDYGKTLTVHFNAGKCLSGIFEIPGKDTSVCWCNIAGSGKHEGKGMFGRGYGIASWGIHDNDPMSACCFPIDVINPYSSSPDCAEPGCTSDNLGVGLGLGTND